MPPYHSLFSVPFAMRAHMVFDCRPRGTRRHAKTEFCPNCTVPSVRTFGTVPLVHSMFESDIMQDHEAGIGTDVYEKS